MTLRKEADVNRSSLSAHDRDRVVVLLRRVGAAQEDLRREYPEVSGAARAAGVADAEPLSSRDAGSSGSSGD